MTTDIQSRSLSSRVILLCMVDLERSGATPVHTAEIISAARERLESVETDTLGRLSEAGVSRSVKELEADGLLEVVETEDRSPTGKGRPTYTMAVDTGIVIEGLAGDEAVAALADHVASAS